MARFSGGSGSGSGAPGPRGPEGDSAYDVAVANGFVGTEQEWLDSLGGGGTADMADFIFTAEEGQSVISLPSDRQMRIEAGIDSDLYLTAGDDLYIQTLGDGDDIFISAADDIRFSSNNQNSETETVYNWLMNSEGEFHLPGPGYISNPYATVVNSGNMSASYSDNYLNSQSDLIDANSVALTVDFNSAWFADYNNQNSFSSPAIVTFADSSTVSLIAIYDATSQGTPAVIFQWSENITKTFADAYPLTVSVDYTTTTYDGNPTIVLDPADEFSDQVLVIEATAPNHIHLRAGGQIDNSNAELFLGGEDTHVRVTDQSGSVEILATDITISSYSAPSSLNINTYSGAIVNSNRTSSYNPEDRVVATLGDISGTKTFDQITVQNNDGTGQNIKIGDDVWLGDLNVANYVGIVGAQDPTVGGIILGNSGTETIAAVDGDVYINSGGAMTLTANGGNMNFYMDGAAYIGNAETDNRIVTVGELNGTITDAEPEEVSFTVNGGTLGTQPTFAGAPMFSGTYVKHGPMVHFQIQVDMDNITSFGTGQYFVDLPFPAKYGYQVTEGCLHDASTGKQYAMGGHVYAGESRLTLSFTDTNGQDAPFDFNSPVTLTTEDNFHIAGTYITV